MKLSKEQIKEIKPELIRNGTPVRFMLKGQSLNIETGGLTPRGVNVISQIVYWNFSRETARKVACMLGVRAVFSD